MSVRDEDISTILSWKHLVKTSVPGYHEHENWKEGELL